MPNTSLGTPYVSSSDLVAGYPTVSLDLANKVDTKADYAMPANTQTGTTYTFVLADGLKLTTASNASPVTLTIPPQSSVVWPNNTILRVVNYGAGAVTIAGGVGVTVTNTAKTLAQFESAALIRTASNAWTLAPFSGGAKTGAVITSTTGSPTITEGILNGVKYDVYQFNASGSITIGTRGFLRYLVAAGGGGSNAGSTGGGGGAGGLLQGAEFKGTGTFTVTVGAGGAAGRNQGSNSVFDAVTSTGGGGGGPSDTTGQNGGSGGGAGAATTSISGGTGIAGQGNNGGGGNAGFVRGGGGGAGGVGTAGTPGIGGAGLQSDVTTASVYYSAGGNGGGTAGGGTGWSATANTGNGGSNGSAGYSGVVIIAVPK